MTPEEAFGKVLRRLRNEAGISQEQLAFMCDLDRTFISMLERGVRQPSLASIIAISEALQTPPWEIIREVMGSVDENTEKGSPEESR